MVWPHSINCEMQCARRFRLTFTQNGRRTRADTLTTPLSLHLCAANACTRHTHRHRHTHAAFAAPPRNVRIKYKCVCNCFDETENGSISIQIERVQSFRAAILRRKRKTITEIVFVPIWLKIDTKIVWPIVISPNCPDFSICLRMQIGQYIIYSN